MDTFFPNWFTLHSRFAHYHFMNSLAIKPLTLPMLASCSTCLWNIINICILFFVPQKFCLEEEIYEIIEMTTSWFKGTWFKLCYHLLPPHVVSKPLWLSFFCKTQNKVFWRNFHVFIHIMKVNNSNQYWTPLTFFVWRKKTKKPWLHFIISTRYSTYKSFGKY